MNNNLIATADAWRDQGKPVPLVLPSGLTVMVKRMLPADVLRLGIIDLPILRTMMAMADLKDNPDNLDRLQKDSVHEVFTALEQFAVAVVVEPRVVPANTDVVPDGAIKACDIPTGDLLHIIGTLAKEDRAAVPEKFSATSGNSGASPSNVHELRSESSSPDGDGPAVQDGVGL